MLLLIDNYDSFVWNLARYVSELGHTRIVVRNDATSLEDIAALAPTHIIVSPGPCTPREAGISNEVLRRFSERKPIFGVCLGHQSITEVFGGKVVRNSRLMHGKTSLVHHRGQGVFAGLPNPFVATRYHSLVIEQSSLPSVLEVTAWTEDESGRIEEIMGVRHREFSVEGVQFHPESILTEGGHALLRNFLAQQGGRRQ